MSVKKKVSTTEVKHSSSSLNGSNMIGFIGAVLILINAVVGIGIYFKNSRVFSANNNNFLGIMFSWIIGFVIMLCVIAIISQVLTAKTKTPLKDMGDWQRTFTGRHIGLFFKIYLPLVYFTFMYFVLAFFAAEALAFVGGFEGEHIIFIFLIAFGLLLVTSIGYIVAEKFSINFSKIGPFIKFVPFLMLIVVAIIVAIVSPSKTYFSGTHEGFEVGSFSVTGILSTLPSVLFAFDGFMIIASISHKIKNSEKNMP
jgi:amino acid transporter